MTLTDEQAPEPNAPSRQPATPKPYEIEGAIVARLGVALTILLALFLLACGGAGQAVDSSTADANPPAAAVEPTTNGKLSEVWVFFLWIGRSGVRRDGR